MSEPKIVEAVGRGRLVAGALRAFLPEAPKESAPAPVPVRISVVKRDADGNVIGEHTMELNRGND